MPNHRPEQFESGEVPPMNEVRERYDPAALTVDDALVARARGLALSEDGYRRNSDLSPLITDSLPDAAQTVYRLAYNSALAAGQDAPSADGAGWAAVRAGWEEGVIWHPRSD